MKNILITASPCGTNFYLTPVTWELEDGKTTVHEVVVADGEKRYICRTGEFDTNFVWVAEPKGAVKKKISSTDICALLLDIIYQDFFINEGAIKAG